MSKNNIFLTLVSALFLLGCGNEKEVLYREGQPTSVFGYPEDKKVARSFYLLGDGGYSKPGGTSAGLIALEAHLDSVKQEGNYTLFLGDNIYPDGMEEEGHPLRERGEYRIDAQLEAVENYDGQVIFMPGNHDWYNEGIDGLYRQRDYIVSQLEDEAAFAPEPGCPLKSISVSDKIQLLVVDSQWYLVEWDENVSINDDCAIKSREAFFLALEDELEEHQNKVVIFAIHHPLYTNGIHGGAYDFNQHLYPSQRKIPVPILGSLVMLVRTSGGISSTDTQNLRYKSLRMRLETLARRWDNIVFVSGHEHSLQYIEKEGVKQIVSGSGSKGTYVNLGQDGLFAFSGQGFVVLDVFEDGAVWASFYGSFEKKPKLLYQKKVLQLPKKNQERVQVFPRFPATVKASVYKPSEEEEKSAAFEAWWGQRYRELYETPVEAKVALLDTLYGGLEVIRKGGGHQTKTLRLRDSLGREYNMRAVRKDALQFLQTTVFKNKWVKDDFKNTITQDLIEDFYTAAHPYAFLMIPELSKAAGVYYTQPKLYYVPRQEALGPYNEEFGNALYMIEERPEEHWKGYESFGAPNHDIESTAGLFERLRRDEKYRLDEASYIRARIFDMLIGDWDRHQDQWRWAEFEDAKGNHIFRPIPRDRDQAFSNFDGAFMESLRGMTGLVNQFSIYEENIEDVAWFNSGAMGLDRTLLQNTTREEWIQQAEMLRENISDQVIERAFSRLPDATRGASSRQLKKVLKARRDNIVDIVKRYYKVLAEYSIVTGTDKDDFAEVERLADGKTKVTISRIKDGEKADIVSTKIYEPEFTEEIWIYGLDDEDKLSVTGQADPGILVRLIGGHGKDIYRIKEGSQVKVYDYKSRPNVVEVNRGADLEFTDDYEVNVFNKDRKIYKTRNLLPVVGYNPDDGVKLGLDASYTFYRFRRNPFTSQHSLSLGYFFASNSYEIHYDGEFAHAWGDFNFTVGADFTSPKYTRNFFGFGNESLYLEDEVNMDYNRVRISRIGAEAGFVRESPFGSFFRYTLSFEGVKIEPTQGRFLVEDFRPGKKFFKRKYFLGLNAIYRYASYDDVLNPTNGMRFQLYLGGKMQTQVPDQIYGFIEPYLGFYRALSRDRKWVLNPRVEAKINIGDDFHFYQAASLGGDTGLRGYRHDRFSGESALATGVDLRYSFESFRTSIVPLQVGLFTGYDLGRVWLDQENSNLWHDSYGGGFWINGAHALTAKFSLFKGSEDLRFFFNLGLNF